MTKIVDVSGLEPVDWRSEDDFLLSAAFDSLVDWLKAHVRYDEQALARHVVETGGMEQAGGLIAVRNLLSAIESARQEAETRAHKLDDETGEKQ